MRIPPHNARIAALVGCAAVAGAWALAAVQHDIVQVVASPGLTRIIAADALLIEAVMVTVLAPVLGAALAGKRGALGAALSTFTLVSCIAALVAAYSSGYSRLPILRAHAILAIVAIALASLGALAASRIHNLLDATAAAATISVTAAVVLLAGGPATANLSERTINAGLLASPTIAIASAAGMDLLRTDLVYRLSPVAHRRFAYPTWRLTTLTYCTLAVVCIALTRKGSRA